MAEHRPTITRSIGGQMRIMYQDERHGVCIHGPSVDSSCSDCTFAPVVATLDQYHAEYERLFREREYWNYLSSAPSSGRLASEHEEIEERAAQANNAIGALMKRYDIQSRDAAVHQQGGKLMDDKESTAAPDKFMKALESSGAEQWRIDRVKRQDSSALEPARVSPAQGSNEQAAAVLSVEAALAELRELFPRSSWQDIQFVYESGLKVTVAFNGYSSGYSTSFTRASLTEAMASAREFAKKERG